MGKFLLQDINFWGSVYTTKFAAPHLRNCGGRIIVLSSVASCVPPPRMSIYSVISFYLLYFFAFSHLLLIVVGVHMGRF
ncbi:putative 11-beta-hydroxysteroid dehydrogenase [Helianthus debilis subsp. tardiflorus]